MQALGARASAWGANEVISVRPNKGTAEQRDGRQGRVLITLPATPSPPTLMSHNDVIIMLMRCLDDLIRHAVIGWQVSDIAFTSRGVRRRCGNYFLGPVGGAHAPRCADYITIIPTRSSCRKHGDVWRDRFSQMYLQLYNYNAIPYE